MILGLEQAAYLSSATRHYTTAVAIWGAAVTATQRAEFYESEKDNQLLSERMNAARAALGEEAFAEAWERGQNMTLAEAVDYVLGLEEF